MRLMSMSRFIALGAAGVAGMAIGYFAEIHATPYQMMALQVARFEKSGGGLNRAMVGPPGKNLKRNIEKANPDIQSIICPYDLSAGPVRLKGPVWDGYWSLSFFGANSDNFAILTDRDIHERFDVLLVPQGMAVAPSPGVRVITSPSRRGIAGVRMFVGSEDDKRRAHAAAVATTCAPVRT